jgi:hypothetical protein
MAKSSDIAIMFCKSASEKMATLIIRHKIQIIGLRRSQRSAQ